MYSQAGALVYCKEKLEQGPMFSKDLSQVSSGAPEALMYAHLLGNPKYARLSILFKEVLLYTKPRNGKLNDKKHTNPFLGAGVWNRKEHGY